MFSDNEARRAGISIYAEPIFSCYINNSDFLKSPDKIMAYYYQHFNFTNTKSKSSLLQVSTISQTLTEGADVRPPLQIYPGQEIYYCISARDALDRNVYSTIAIDIVRNYSQHTIPKTTKTVVVF